MWHLSHADNPLPSAGVLEKKNSPAPWSQQDVASIPEVAGGKILKSVPVVAKALARNFVYKVCIYTVWLVPLSSNSWQNEGVSFEIPYMIYIMLLPGSPLQRNHSSKCPALRPATCRSAQFLPKSCCDRTWQWPCIQLQLQLQRSKPKNLGWWLN